MNNARRHVGLVLALVVLISTATLATGPIRPASAKADAQTWSYTGSLKQARAYHTATLLADGKVLVVGGSPSDTDALGVLASAELYEPVTGTWSFTGSPNVPRGAYTATLLANGKCLWSEATPPAEHSQVQNFTTHQPGRGALPAA